MVNDCDNHTMVNDCDDHTGSEYYCDNHIGLASYHVCDRCLSYPYENDHNIITSVLAMRRNESSCSNVVLKNKIVHSLIDNEVESRNTWIPTIIT